MGHVSQQGLLTDSWASNQLLLGLRLGLSFLSRELFKKRFVRLFLLKKTSHQLRFRYFPPFIDLRQSGMWASSDTASHNAHFLNFTFISFASTDGLLDLADDFSPVQYYKISEL